MTTKITYKGRSCRTWSSSNSLPRNWHRCNWYSRTQRWSRCLTAWLKAVGVKTDCTTPSKISNRSSPRRHMSESLISRYRTPLTLNTTSSATQRRQSSAQCWRINSIILVRSVLVGWRGPHQVPSKRNQKRICRSWRSTSSLPKRVDPKRRDRKSSHARNRQAVSSFNRKRNVKSRFR